MVKKLLKKVFKLFGLHKNAEKEYSRPSGYESLRKKFDVLVKRVEKREKKEESSSESSGDDAESGEAREKEDLGKRQDRDAEDEEVADEQVLKVKKQVYGPTRPGGERDGMGNGEESGIGEQQVQIADEGFFDSLLKGKGFQSEHRAKLRQGILGPKQNQREKVQETEEEQQVKLKKFFEDYDKVNRPKTLLEIHQERSKPEGKQREAFDRSSLGGYSRVDSKSVFQMVNSAGANLSSKFGNGKFKGTFM